MNTFIPADLLQSFYTIIIHFCNQTTISATEWVTWHQDIKWRLKIKIDFTPYTEVPKLSWLEIYSSLVYRYLKSISTRFLLFIPKVFLAFKTSLHLLIISALQGKWVKIFLTLSTTIFYQSGLWVMIMYTSNKHLPNNCDNQYYSDIK